MSYSPAPNKTQWGGQQYQPVYEPGPTPNYGGPSYGYGGGGPPPEQAYVSDSKSPYDGGRFAPKKRVNDWVFLVLFIAQVCLKPDFWMPPYLKRRLVCWLCCSFCYCLVGLGQARGPRRRSGEGRYWQCIHAQQVRNPHPPLLKEDN